MTTLMNRDPGSSAEHEQLAWQSVVGAVLHFAERVLSPMPDGEPSPAVSEHFGHAEKRNDPSPAWETPAGYVG